MASYTTTLSLSGAYRIDEKLLEEVFALAQRFVDKEISVDLHFGKTNKLRTTSLNDALNDSLVQSEFITMMDISGNNFRTEPKRIFRFKLDGDDFGPTSRLDVEGDQDASRALSSNIARLLKAKRQWYSLMIIGESFPNLIVLLVLAAAIFATPVLLAARFAPTGVPWLLGAEMVGFLVWLFLLNQFRRILFPKLIILLGASADVDTGAKSGRTVLFSSIFLALVVSVVGSLVAYYLTLTR